MLGWEILFNLCVSMDMPKSPKMVNVGIHDSVLVQRVRLTGPSSWNLGSPGWLSQKRWKQSTADHRCYYSFLCCLTLIHNLNSNTFFSKSKIQNKFKQMSGYKPKRPAPPPPNMPSHDKLRTYFDRWIKIISLDEGINIILGLMQTSLELSHLRSYKRPWLMVMERNSTWQQSTWW